MAAALGMMCPRTRGRRARLALVASVSLVVLASPVSRAHAAAPAWTTYHHDSQRSGIDPDSAAAIPPEVAWQTPALDDKISAEPLVYGSLVYVATKNDTVYALNAATGAIAWQSHVGTAVPTGKPGLELKTECNQMGSQVGIVSTPVIDPATNAIYAVTNTWSGTHESVRHELVALDLNTGAMLPGFPIAVDPPYPAGGSAAQQLQRPALALDAGRVIIGYGSYGDCNTYWGWLVSAPESGIGPLRVFQVDQNHEQGSIWGSGNAPLIEPDGDIYVATGNGSSGKTFENGDAVLRLDSNLNLLEAWAPANREELDLKDLDLGSSNPVPLPGTGLIFEGGKAGDLVLLRAGALGHGEGPAVESLQVCTKSLETEIFGGGIYLPGSAPGTGAIYLTCIGEGVKKIAVTGLPSTPKLSVVSGWPKSEAENIVGPPIFAGGLVWVANWAGPPATTGTPGTLYGVDPQSGEVKFHEALGPNLHFATPSAGGGRLFVASGAVVDGLTIATPPAPSQTATAIAASSNPTLAGQPVSYTAAVSPAPDSGSVSFTQDGLPIPGCEAVRVDVATGGGASCVTSYPQGGGHTILASYSGDPYYTPSSSAPLGELIAQPLSVPLAPPAPLISGASQWHRRWREGSAHPRFSRHGGREPVGTSFTFALNESATVHFVFEREMAGRRLHGLCVALPRGRAHKQHHLERCMHRVQAAALEFAGHPGENQLSFAGRTSGKGRLAPGGYVLVITAANANGTSAPANLSFQILKG